MLFERECRISGDTTLDSLIAFFRELADHSSYRQRALFCRILAGVAQDIQLSRHMAQHSFVNSARRLAQDKIVDVRLACAQLTQRLLRSARRHISPNFVRQLLMSAPGLCFFFVCTSSLTFYNRRRLSQARQRPS